MQNEKELKKLATVFNVDNIITSQDIQDVLKGIFDIMASFKKDNIKLNIETTDLVENLLIDVSNKIESGTLSIIELSEEVSNTFNESIKEVRLLIQNIQTIKPVNGVDGKDAVVDYDTIYTTVLDKISDSIKTIGIATSDDLNDLKVYTEEEIELLRKNCDEINKILAEMPSKKGNLIGPRNITSMLSAGTNVTITGSGTIDDPYIVNSSGGGGGAPGGSDTQLQYNNAGAFGGVSGATTNGTSITFTTGNLLAQDVKASGSGGLHLHNNTGQDCFLVGLGGGINNTAYGALKLDFATATTVPYIDASKNLISSAVTPTELGYLSGVTSAIQTQLNSKVSSQWTTLVSDIYYDTGAVFIGMSVDDGGALQVKALGGDDIFRGYDNSGAVKFVVQSDGQTIISPLASGGTSPTMSGTAKAVITDTAGRLGFSATTSTELGYLSGVTSAVQTQLGTKQTTGTDITLAENTSIILDPILSADGKYTGITRTGTAGATLAFGDLCYLDPTDSRWELVDANSAQGADGDSRGVVGMCVLAAAGDGSATNMLLYGTIRADTAFPAMTVNNQMYISETAGDITGTQPSTSGVVIRVVGVALTADELLFNPSPDYITHA